MKRQLLNPKRVFYLMIAVVLLVAGLGVASVVLGNGFLQKQSDHLVNLKLQYRVPEENQTALKQAKADIEKYDELKKTAQTIVPQQKDQAQAVREIVNYANTTYDTSGKNGIKILSITFPSSTLGQTSTPVAGSSTTTTTPKVTTPPVTQVQPVTGVTGVYVLPITVQSDPSAPVSFNQLVSFLTKLENNRRTAQVSQISISPQKGGVSTQSGLSFTITVNTYIKP